MKILLGIIALVLVVSAGGWYVAHYDTGFTDGVACTLEARICPDGTAVGRTGPNCEFAACPNENGQSVGAPTEHFMTMMQQKVVREIGQPIEGFEPFMYLRVYPKLLPVDFDTVEAELGLYSVDEEGIIYTRHADVTLVHSAERAITPYGMGILLENIAARLDLPIETTEEIDTLLGYLSAGVSTTKTDDTKNNTGSDIDDAVDEKPAGNQPVISGRTKDLSGQGLTKVPDSIFTDNSIEILDLSHNALTGALQAEVRHLTKLRMLDLSDNNFTGVPAEVGQLSKLEVLDLSNNQLTGLPYELGNLSNLKTLDLSGNQYAEADLEVIKGGLSSDTNIITH